jgi:hypothetical protein
MKKNYSKPGFTFAAATLQNIASVFGATAKG